MTNPEENPARLLADWADELRHISANGAQYANNRYDKDNYERIRGIAMMMLALANDENIERLEPLRATLFARPTPLFVVDAAIIDEQGRILLIQRADNKKWAMPGGGADIGETPSEAAVREALEETGVSCYPVALVGLHDSQKNGNHFAQQLIHAMFLCRVIPDKEIETPASHAEEVLQWNWFAEDSLPAEMDPSHEKRIAEAFRVWHGDKSAYFD